MDILVNAEGGQNRFDNLLFLTCVISDGTFKDNQ